MEISVNCGCLFADLAMCMIGYDFYGKITFTTAAYANVVVLADDFNGRFFFERRIVTQLDDIMITLNRHAESQTFHLVRMKTHSDTVIITPDSNL